ncbi:MAG: hypothetical protein R3296_00105 [Oleiphilaceae bacterium]|nr:hypothetical protein [Oleiphilaceae bacterium]
MANVRQYRIRSRLSSIRSRLTSIRSGQSSRRRGGSMWAGLRAAGSGLVRFLSGLASSRERAKTLALLGEKLPTPLLVPFSRRVLGPEGVARALTHMDPERIATLSQSFSPRFIAGIAVALDPESRARILKPLPFDVVLATARPLIEMEAYRVTADFAAMLPRPHLKQLVVQLNDPVGVAHISGHMPVERSAEVLLAFSPRLAAQVLNEVMNQGYRDTVSSVGPLLSEERREAMTPYLIPRTRDQLVSRLG